MIAMASFAVMVKVGIVFSVLSKDLSRDSQ